MCCIGRVVECRHGRLKPCCSSSVRVQVAPRPKTSASGEIGRHTGLRSRRFGMRVQLSPRGPRFDSWWNGSANGPGDRPDRSPLRGAIQVRLKGMRCKRIALVASGVQISRSAPFHGVKHIRMCIGLLIRW